MTKDFSGFQKKLGLKFHNPDLLEQAFVHRSYLNENPDSGLEHNERLEFLGDAVLELVVTEYLYAKYPEKNEGELTSFRAAMVNSVMLSEVAQGIGMGDYLLLSRGEARDLGKARQYILANTLEALVGAIYLDGGYEGAHVFLKETLFPKIHEVHEKKLWIDAKSHFQEKAQEVAGTTPSYKVINESGPDHAKNFIVGVYLGEICVAKGEGFSKQEAEQAAARNGLELKGWE
ncbi:MAG TPA: ribonuclease III [Candidatus Paceibacterota bacterium]